MTMVRVQVRMAPAMVPRQLQPLQEQLRMAPAAERGVEQVLETVLNNLLRQC
jgi:hypothetical protein